MLRQAQLGLARLVRRERVGGQRLGGSARVGGNLRIGLGLGLLRGGNLRVGLGLL